MKIGRGGLDLIQSFEGYHKRLPNGDCQAYLDTLVSPGLRSPGYKGLWTIGWGNTGPDITEGTVWTRKQAEERFLKMVERHETAVQKAVHVPLTQHQFDALVSLSYNMGIGKAKTLLNKLNAGDYDGAADAFLLYENAGGRQVDGLTRRRRAERELFLRESSSKPSIVEKSRKLNVIPRFRQWIAGLGITAAAAMQMFQDVQSWIQANTGVALIISGVSIWLLLKWIEAKSVEDYKEGRYIPSGENADTDLDS